MRVEHLEALKEKYTSKCNYFKNAEFNNLAADFNEMVSILNQMINYVKENPNNNTLVN